MDVVWERGDSNVRDVTARLRSLAYTTIMTTMVRLHEKGLLDRSLNNRSFVYRPRIAKEIWEQMAIEHFLAWCRSRSLSADVLISWLVDAAGVEDESLLDDLERRIKAKREECRSNRRASRGMESPGRASRGARQFDGSSEWLLKPDFSLIIVAWGENSTRQRRTGDRQTQIQRPHIDRNSKREPGLEPMLPASKRGSAQRLRIKPGVWSIALNVSFIVYV